MPKKLKLTPINDRAFIDYADVAEPNEVGGILLPENFDRGQGKVLYVEATVLSCGPECKQLRPGQKIIVAKGHIERIAIGKELHFLINEKSVNGIVE